MNPMHLSPRLAIRPRRLEAMRVGSDPTAEYPIGVLRLWCPKDELIMMSFRVPLNLTQSCGTFKNIEIDFR